jgi:hypothetical protein
MLFSVRISIVEQSSYAYICFGQVESSLCS